MNLAGIKSILRRVNISLRGERWAIMKHAPFARKVR